MVLTQIKPSIKYIYVCPYCKNKLIPDKVIWQGIHVCYETICENCNSEIIGDLPTGQGIIDPCQVDKKKQVVFTESGKINKWFGEYFLYSLVNQNTEKVKVFKKVFKSRKDIIILNCIDVFYGHCVLKLLNAQRHLEDNRDLGLVIIAPKFLEWMLPDGIAESWIVDIPLRYGKNYYSYLNDWINRELKLFETVYLSEAYSHPSRFDITNFTKIKKHDFSSDNIQVGFIWREDRIWFNEYLSFLLRFLNINLIGLIIQNLKIQILFKRIQNQFPNVEFVVVGFGTKTSFPKWIQDKRTNNFAISSEKELCKIYADSRLIIGVHGSNMLLPSGHAGMTLDLMPNTRWGNFAQDILYHETNSRLASFRYRYLPFSTPTPQVANIVITMLQTHNDFFRWNTDDLHSCFLSKNTK